MHELERSLLTRDRGADRPTLENRVAFQWDRPQDLLAYRNATRRDAAVLGWLSDGAHAHGLQGSVLDIGCSYGNYMLMLNAVLGKDPRLRYIGIDLDEEALTFGRDFAAAVPGYENCEFRVHDIEKGLPFEDNSFFAVVIADVLEHLPDPVSMLRDIRRVLQPNGTLVLCMPLRTSAFKRASAAANRLSRGQLNRAYYSGKDDELDEMGRPIMYRAVGHDHISEMTYPELANAVEIAGFSIRDRQFMGVMSGSRWFAQHPVLQWTLLGVEALHDRLQRASWAHGVCLHLVSK
jgi:SAM-dependent methyltransferase